MECRPEHYCGVPNERSIILFAQVDLSLNLPPHKIQVICLGELLSYPAAMSAKNSVQMGQEGIGP